jgi:hypothetical protein
VYGTPLAEGKGSLELTAENDSTVNGVKTGEKHRRTISYPIEVVAAELPFFNSPSSLVATQNADYTATITVENARSVALVSAAALPPGIAAPSTPPSSPTPSTLELPLTGKPSAAGTYTVEAKATNADGTSTRSYTIQVAPPLLPVINTPIALQPGTVGMPYTTATLTATNPVTEWKWKGTPSTPPGLALITTATGNRLIAGSPTEAGTYVLTFTAKNGVGESTSRTDSMTIKPQTMPVSMLTSRELEVGSSAQIQIGMGLPPTRADSVVIEITGSAISADTLYLLEAGTFILNATRAGTSVVTVQYYDSTGTLISAAEKSYTIEVYAPPTSVTVTRRVFVPAVEGAILSESGQCGVLSGRDFEFTIRPTGDQAGKVPVVKSDRQMADGKTDVEVTRDATDRGLYHVRVLQVQSPVTLTITFRSESSNQLIQDTKVWGGKETLHIFPVLRGEAVIYGSAGERVAIAPLEAGQESIVPLPAGVYVVVLDGGISFKAIVNSK